MWMFNDQQNGPKTASEIGSFSFIRVQLRFFSQKSRLSPGKKQVSCRFKPHNPPTPSPSQTYLLTTTTTTTNPTNFNFSSNFHPPRKPQKLSCLPSSAHQSGAVPRHGSIPGNNSKRQKTNPWIL